MGDNSQKTIKIHNTVVAVITIAGIGAVAESVSQRWEFWVPPLILIGIISAWWIHVTQKGTARIREDYYLIFSMVIAFYHGAHRSSFFDIFVIAALLMAVSALILRVDFLRLIMLEFMILMVMHIGMATSSDEYVFDSMTISRVALHIVALICLYIVLKAIVDKIQDSESTVEKLEKTIESNDNDMEDFLVNLSHELRTPINVINGLTDLILKREKREDIKTIKNAGVRISHQIEDIQDYSEIQRQNVIVENERYMITSLLNDILMNYSLMRSQSPLDFVVDLDPEVPAVMKGDMKKIHKIISHLLDNAFKFTRKGGACLRITSFKKDYGVNLIIEVSDTGVGMTQRDINRISRGMYKADRKRDKSTGGVGLGLSVVLGLVRSMDGFVKIESQKNLGTTVRISIFQEVIDSSPCMALNTDRFVNVVIYNWLDRFQNPILAGMYKNMSENLAKGLRHNLFFAATFDEFKKLIARGDITHVYMGDREYLHDKSFFENELDKNIVFAVTVDNDFIPDKDSRGIVLRKPVYGMSLVQVLNGTSKNTVVSFEEDIQKPDLTGIRALVVDDEPMNLVVATGLFKEYNMSIDTADSGIEAIDKFTRNSYDVIFMDHMMPQMDGVEAMKRIKSIAERDNRRVSLVALTANAVSGAKEMFIKEGFDGFISKPISIGDFERVMQRIISEGKAGRGGVQ
ncbi:response regulator [Butyrivibrio sp. CB08]|uniref:hybrid sensor histidine kinase/response regulator n=1 Tax=Butyrivibrio sp. CB08 TaxID=2364879 RepID=UPI000EA9644B|nr:response regulator [Butyrivibrio sp. CB08]RKM61126.1 response regulator [Butyrivibrio sp. CB08]